MKKINTFVHVELPYFWGHVVYVSKVLMFQAALVLMIMGVLYALNFRVEIKPVVTVISPIVEVK